MTQLRIEMRALESILPYERNPRRNSMAVDAVARSIQTYGFRQPLVVDADGVIVVGHTRYKAAIQLGLNEVPVVVAADLTPTQLRAYRIADNATGAIAQWDDELLPLELADLQALDFDLDLLGFSDEQLAHHMNVEPAAGLCDPDDVPEPPDEAVTQPGDLWLLGEHRLLCGDSARAEDVDRLLDGVRIQLVNSDPPYGVGVAPRSNNAVAAGLSSFTRGEVARRRDKSRPAKKKLRAKDRPLKNDFLSEEEFERLLLAWFGNMARVLEPGRSFYLWGGFSNCANYPSALKRCGLYFSQAIIWDKQHPVLTRKDFMTAHEWCFYGWKVGAAHVFYGPANVPDLWHVKKISPQKMVHLTEKPTELAVRSITYSSRPGENVLDLFGGAGSTLIAAQQTGRRACLMELDPLYCDVIVRRFEQFTGQTATRAGRRVA